MRPYILLAVIGILVAGLAALAVRNAVPPPAAEQAATPAATAKILVAQETIPAGSFVRAEAQLNWGDWPADQAKAPYITQAEGADAASFNGAVARRTIFAGEPITASSVVKPGEGGFMSAVLTPGERAVSVPVNATTGNAGFIFPGDRVDLILTHTLQRDNSQSFASETFVEDVRVLAVDQMLDNPENKAVLAKTVTLEVSPQEAEAITVALEMGKISLSLRSLAKDDAPPAGVAVEGNAPAEVAAQDRPDIDYFYPDNPGEAEDRRFTRDRDISKLLGNSGGGATTKVRVIRGQNATDLEFPNSN